LSACGGGGDQAVSEGESASPAPTPDDGTTTSAAPTPAPPTAPLTGVPVEQPINRPALVVKIDNDPQARPQTGLNQADVVYEVRVEGITRFATVFHSGDAEPVGPIRSARSSDLDLVSNLNRPLFAWSGGNPTVTAEIQGGEDTGILMNLSHDRSAGDYHRDSSRPAPFNLFSSTSALWAHATPDAGGPSALFRYRADGDALPASAIDVPGITVDYGSTRIPSVEFVWDAEVGGWRRFQVDSHHGFEDSAYVDSLGQQVAPPNVVVMFTPYTTSAAGGGSPQAMSVGEGEAAILTDGRMVPGRWSRPTFADPLTFTDPTGQSINLTPGQTWVLLPEAGKSQLLNQEQADALLFHKR
jgi:hypothetical protein